MSLPPPPLTPETLSSARRLFIGRPAAAGMAAKARHGGWPGRAPLGYRNVRNDGLSTVELDPTTAPLVKEAFYLLGRRGASLRTVAVVLAEMGLSNQRGQPLAASTLREMIRNSFYVGMVTFKGRLTEGRHQPLVCPSAFDRANRALHRRFRK